MDHLTPLKAVLGHHVYLVGRPRQGQHAIAVSRSPGQGQGHRGRKNFFKVKNFFCLKMSKMHKKLKKNFDLEKIFFDPCDLDLHPVTLTLLWHVDLA